MLVSTRVHVHMEVHLWTTDPTLKIYVGGLQMVAMHWML